MKRIRWVCSRLGLTALLLLAMAASAHSQAIRPRQADVVITQDTEPPRSNAGWERVDLPASAGRSSAWYRIAFDMTRPLPDTIWAVYLPYFNGGGRLILNGMPLANIQEPSADVIVRWERPHLIPIPDALLRPGTNELLIRVAATPVSNGRMSLLAIGPHVQLLPEYERRLFWVRTMSQFTVIACLIVGELALFIWWRRREESLYGLFGAAALLWGVRTLTFVIEVMPSGAWHAWRTIYHGATGGFAIVMLLFTLCLAGMRYPLLSRLLFGYWLLGPLGYLASGGNEVLIGRYWAGGLLPIGFAVLVISATAAWRQRTSALILLSLALALAVFAGLHDYLLATASPALLALAPHAAHRLFLLNYAADVLLVIMGVILSVRLVGTLQAIEQLNRTLESRVAEREAALSENHARLRRLEREQAVGEERQQIMRDLHDGLGSHLFLTLSRVEVGRIDQQEIVQSLRECIADLRLTLEAMSPQGNDFLEAWGNFRFRWQQLLEASGLDSSWEIEAKEGDRVELTPHVMLQLLRIVQEALTNVLKHAGAGKVAIRLRTDPRSVGIEVVDDGRGLGDGRSRAGHGLTNMRARASRVGARIEIADQHPGVRVTVGLNRQSASL